MTITSRRLMAALFCLGSLAMLLTAETSAALVDKAEVRRVQEEARENAEYRKLMLAAKLASMKVDAHITKRQAKCAAQNKVLTSGGDGQPTCGPKPDQPKTPAK